ncbi:MAG: hypothetical protein WCI94_20315 [Rhodospirillales bacterium]
MRPPPRTPGGGVTGAQRSLGGDNASSTKTAPHLQRRSVLALQLARQAYVGPLLGWHGLAQRLTLPKARPEALQ